MFLSEFPALKSQDVISLNLQVSMETSGIMTDIRVDISWPFCNRKKQGRVVSYMWIEHTHIYGFCLNDKKLTT